MSDSGDAAAVYSRELYRAQERIAELEVRIVELEKMNDRQMSYTMKYVRGLEEAALVFNLERISANNRVKELEAQIAEEKGGE
jgi:hypothetical protein